MKTLVQYYKLLMVAVVVAGFLPPHAMWAYEYEATYQGAASDQTADLYYGWDGHMYKEIEIAGAGCDREFYLDDSGFEMYSDWEIYVEAEVGSTLEEYSDTIELTGMAYHVCMQTWEWSGPPATAPGAQIEYSLWASALQSSNGDIFLTTGTPFLLAMGSAIGDAEARNDAWYTSPENIYVSAEGWGWVTNSQHGADHSWDNNQSASEPNGYHTHDGNEYDAGYYPWSFGEYNYTYYVDSGVAYMEVIGATSAAVDVEVRCDVESDENGSALCRGTSNMESYCSFSMTPN